MTSHPKVPEDTEQPAGPVPVAVSVVVPVKDEADNILPLIDEIGAALTATGSGSDPDIGPSAAVVEIVPVFEIIYVDDGSTDATPQRLDEARARWPQLRVLQHAESCGQSQALRTGILAARGKLIATLDGDGQNDPADLPAMIEAFHDAAASVGPGDVPPVAMVAGHRQSRQDSRIRLVSSRIANTVRARLLSDDTPDSGCGIKVFRREVFLRLPFFDHMHRFLPSLVRREGFDVLIHPVAHRPRTRGRSKYGVHNRLWVGIVDLVGVFWLVRRMRRPTSVFER